MASSVRFAPFPREYICWAVDQSEHRFYRILEAYTAEDAIAQARLILLTRPCFQLVSVDPVKPGAEQTKELKDQRRW